MSDTRKNFLNEEKKLLVNVVKSHEILLSNKRSSTIVEEKEKAWLEVVKDYNLKIDDSNRKVCNI